MIKRFLLVSFCVLAAACAKTPEQKAEALIKDAIQKNLVLPESYQAVEIQLDSAFTPYHDPEFVAVVLDICKKGVEIDELDRKMKSSKSSMSIWSGPYMSSFSKEQYKQAKEEYEAAKSKYDALVDRVQKMAEGLREKIEKEPEFIGYRAHHRYRANNNAGNTLLSGEYFLFDKEITQVIAQWDEDEIEIYNEVLKQASEAAEMAQ